MEALQLCNGGRVYTPDAAFWSKWRSKSLKKRMKSNGYHVCKIKDKWYVVKVPGQTTLKLFVEKSAKNGTAVEVPNHL